MENKKIDLRVKYTKKAIYDSILNLLDTNSIDKVTVQDICKGAEINRATFYTHYKNLQALLDEIEIEKSQEIIKILSAFFAGDVNFETTIEATMRCYKNDKLLCRFEFGDLSTGRTIYAKKFAQEQSIYFWLGKGKITRQQAEYLKTFFNAGIRELLCQWYLNGFKDDNNVLKKNIVKIFEKCLEGYFSGDE